MLDRLLCDFHIHTCLSPCADLSMTPRAIVKKAIEKSLNVIAICDHNASENVKYVQKAAKGESILILPGIEVTTKEEVHVLGIFKSIYQLQTFQRYIYDHLPGQNNEELFGCQAVVNEKDFVEKINDRFLLGATTLSLQDVVNMIHHLKGLAIASHVDRQAFGVIGQLGFIDETMNFDALEITGGNRKSFRQKYPELNHFPLIESSDAHYLKDIGKHSTVINVKKATFNEIAKALQNKKGRYVEEDY
ncbi:MAG: PHP domain-containing protein [Syntrophales bacterium]|nr:PHP domain-containing protein [Syntrophales bacterium]